MNYDSNDVKILSTNINFYKKDIEEITVGVLPDQHIHIEQCKLPLPLDMHLDPYQLELVEEV